MTQYERAGGLKRGLAQGLAALGLAFAGVLGAGGLAHAQQATSTGMLKQWCETSPDNVVLVTGDLKINAGRVLSDLYNPSYEQVASGCTVQLGPGSTFEADGVAMAFAGPFVVQGGKSVTFNRSAWKATAHTFDVSSASDGAFSTSNARVDASEGGITIRGGAASKIELQGSQGSTIRTLLASGPIAISGGPRTFMQIVETSMQASGALNIALGNESVLNAARASIRSNRAVSIKLDGNAIASAEATDFDGASVLISGSGPKTQVDLKGGRYQAKNSVAIRLTGAEAVVKAADTRFQSFNDRVDLVAGASAPLGSLELDRISVYAVAGASIKGSELSEFGTVKIGGGSTLRAGGADLVIVSGARGLTEVKDSAFWSDTAVRVRTGPQGTCVAAPNSFISPNNVICP